MQEDALFCGSFSAQPPLVKRLADEFKEATREFRENPKLYITSAIRGDGVSNYRRKSLLKFGLAIAIMLYAIFFAAMLVRHSDRSPAERGEAEGPVHADDGEA